MNKKENQTPSFVLTLSLKNNISDDVALNKYFELSRRFYNAILGETLKRLNLMRQSKEYQKVRKMPKSRKRSQEFKRIEEKYGFTKYSLDKFMTILRINEFKILGSHITGKLQIRAWNTVDKLRFGKAKRVNFIGKDFGLNSIEGKNNDQAVRYRDGIVEFNKLKIPVIIKNNDVYAQLALQSKIKYCRILRKQVGNKIRYYVQLVLQGTPPQKHEIGQGEVGIDIGTQTIAIVSNKEVVLKELAEGLNDIQRDKNKLQRKLDRSRRKMNPNKYNNNGTINIHNKDKWIKSNNYIRIQNKLKNLQRKLADTRKQKHEMMANEILGLGNIIKVEIMQFQRLQKHSKETTVNKKTGKYNKKKRFGKSLANKAPAKLLEILDRKLKYYNLWLFKINTYKVKASQYNPFTNTYNKKELKDRWNKNIDIQRDLMSALIIKNVIIDDKLKLDKIDRNILLSEYDNFKILHDKEIDRLKELKLNGVKLISSMGI
jgi:hypothetical protein